MSSGYGLTGGMCSTWRAECAKRKRNEHDAATPASIGNQAQHADHLCFPTGPSRCFPFWQDVLACYVVNTSTEDDSGKKKCSPVLEDYYECLHHRKEVRNTYPMEERGA
jgi:hypothetical protein